MLFRSSSSWRDRDEDESSRPSSRRSSSMRGGHAQESTDFDRDSSRRWGRSSREEGTIGPGYDVDRYEDNDYYDHH